MTYDVSRNGEIEGTSRYPSIRLEEGDALFQKGRFESAIRFFKNVIEFDPKNARALYKLGLCYLRSDLYQEALDCLRQASEILPNSPWYLKSLGDVLWALHRNQESLDYYRMAVRLDPQNPYFSVIRGDREREMGFLEKALLSYQDVVKIDPQDFLTYAKIAQILYEMGSIDEAIKMYNKSIEFGSSSFVEKKCRDLYLHQKTENLIQWGESFFLKNDFHSAIEAYLKVIEINSKNEYVCFKLAVCYYNLNDYKNAMYYSHRSIELNPNAGHYYHFLGNIFFQSGNYNSAIESFEKSFSMGYISTDGGYLLAMCYHMVGLSKKAQEIAEQSIERNSTLLDYYPRLGDLLNGLGNYPAAVKAYEKAIKLDPQNAELWGLLGDAYFLSGNFDLAKNMYEKAIDLKPDDAELFAKVARLLVQKKSLEESYSWIIKSIDLGQSLIAYEILPDIFLQLNKNNELYEILNRTIKEHPRLGINLSKVSPCSLHESRKSLPPIFINTLVKSGSIYIISRLSAALQIPIVHISLIQRPSVILDEWINFFSQGGMLTHDHMAATNQNIQVMQNHRIHRIVVHVRDPRQSLISWYFYIEKLHNNFSHPQKWVVDQSVPENYWQWKAREKIQYHLDTFFEGIVNWIAGWFQFEKQKDPEISILFTTFQDMIKDEMGMFHRILDFYQIPKEYADFTRNHPSARVHHRRGLEDEWRELMDGIQQDYAWEKMKGPMCERFGWTK